MISEIVERLTFVHDAIWRIERPHSYLSRKTSLILVIDVLFLGIFTSLLNAVHSKDSEWLI